MFWQIVEERPDGFVLRLLEVGRDYRIHPGSFEKHVTEAGRSRIRNRFGSDSGEGDLLPDGSPKGNYWLPSPWIKRQHLELPISALAGALEAITSQLAERPPGRHHFIVGNWDLRVDSTDNPWCVYHAQWDRD